MALPLQLEFITITDRPESAKATYSHVVRSQAMQSFLRTKREVSIVTPKEGNSSLSEAVPLPAKTLISRFKLSTWSRKKIEKSEISTVPKGSDKRKSEHKGTRTQLIGPSLHGYSSLPIQTTREMRRLLYHYNTSYTMNSFALNPEGNWISFSFMDPALLHATLSVVALHRDLLIDNDQSVDSLVHKGQAIKAINVRLQASQSTNDENLAIVALLIKFEIMHGTLEASEHHMSGLLEMLRLRGGLGQLAHNQVLLRVLTWIDLLYATRWGTKPRIVPMRVHKGPLAVTVNSITSKYALPIDQDIVTVRSLYHNPNINLDVLETLRCISAAKAESSKLLLEDRKVVSHILYTLNHRLLMDLSDPGLSMLSSFHQAFSVACVLYINLMIREIPQRAEIHSPMVDRLRSTINSNYFRDLARVDNWDLIVWVVFLGAAASPSEESSEYFIDLLALISKSLSIQDEAQLRQHLKDIVWLDGICDWYLSIVWSKLVAIL